jgi:hypothetical protein
VKVNTFMGHRRGWTFEEAKQHTIVERLYERCQAYSDGTDCRGLDRANRCERCLAAERIEELETWSATWLPEVAAAQARLVEIEVKTARLTEAGRALVDLGEAMCR